MQKIQLFSIDEQQRTDAWLNDSQPMPSVPIKRHTATNAFIATVKLSVEDMVLYEVSRYVREVGDVPAEIRANAWTIFEMSPDRWYAFPFFYEGRIIRIPIVADPRVTAGRVHCVGCCETMVTARAVQ